MARSRLIVQKFGGSSMGSVERIIGVAERVLKTRRSGANVVVVVSAMQGETDRLLSLAQALSERPDLREVDQLLATGEQASAALLAIALHARSQVARSVNGAQMGLRTDGVFSRARIKSVNRRPFETAFAAGEVVVATGFQGVDDQGNITTLGRGGSDTSAVALAAALGADECEIYTDVLGVYTADPRICPTAVKMDDIAFEEMMEMASLGSKVLQIRSVELAMNHGVPLRVRSTFSDDEGTLVKLMDDVLEKLVVRGISHLKDATKFTLRRVPDQPGVASRVFAELAQAQINVDVIVQNTSLEGSTDLSFTVPRVDRLRAEDIVRKTAEDIGAPSVEMDDNIAKISIVGVGMQSHPGVASTMFQALSCAEVNIQMITTSEIKVTCVIEREDCDVAVNALHDAFHLSSTGKGGGSASASKKRTKKKVSKKRVKKANRKSKSSKKKAS